MSLTLTQEPLLDYLDYPTEPYTPDTIGEWHYMAAEMIATYDDVSRPRDQLRGSAIGKLVGDALTAPTEYQVQVLANLVTLTLRAASAGYVGNNIQELPTQELLLQ